MTSVDKVPGIYVIGEKQGSETKYLYAGRSNDVKRRIQEHKSQKQQDIDKRVAGKFKKHKETDLRIKYVPEQRQKSKEGQYIQCLSKKIGYRPVLNKREGDGCAFCAGSQKKSNAKSSKKHSSSKSSPRSSARPKVASSGRSSGSTIKLFLKLGIVNIHDMTIKKCNKKWDHHACLCVSRLFKWGIFTGYALKIRIIFIQN